MQDQRRHTDLLANNPVDPEETAAAIVAPKGDPDLAIQAARQIDIDLLAPSEYLLVARLQADGD